MKPYEIRRLNFCNIEGCFEEKQDGLEVCNTHYQEGMSEIIDDIIMEFD